MPACKACTAYTGCSVHRCVSRMPAPWRPRHRPLARQTQPARRGTRRHERITVGGTICCRRARPRLSCHGVAQVRLIQPRVEVGERALLGRGLLKALQGVFPAVSMRAASVTRRPALRTVPPTCMEACSRRARAASTSASNTPASLAAWKSSRNAAPRLRSARPNTLLKMARERGMWNSEVTTHSLLRPRPRAERRRANRRHLGAQRGARGPAARRPARTAGRWECSVWSPQTRRCPPCRRRTSP